jgi:hypothetical protein
MNRQSLGNAYGPERDPAAKEGRWFHNTNKEGNIRLIKARSREGADVAIKLSISLSTKVNRRRVNEGGVTPTSTAIKVTDQGSLDLGDWSCCPDG